MGTPTTITGPQNIVQPPCSSRGPVTQRPKQQKLFFPGHALPGCALPVLWIALLLIALEMNSCTQIRSEKLSRRICSFFFD